jgi:phosphoribosylanthranilate isomerase
MDVRAKICGLTRPEDAALAVAHGAWRLGVVFAGGPRVVEAARAREIVAAADGVPVLGVFGTQSIGTILKTIHAAGLSGAQLHGGYDADQARQVGAAGLEVWRVLALDNASAVRHVVAERARAADAVLFEAVRPDGGDAGGRGIAVPLDLARQARSFVSPPVRVVLAGGLRPENVADAIAVVRPDAVDVSSGVETSPGVKDSARLIQFLENVRVARVAP